MLKVEGARAPVPHSWRHHWASVTAMDVDHGGRGEQVTPEFGVGEGNANLPLGFCHIQKERSVTFKIRQNPFSARALPRTPLGELKTLPRTL